MGNNILKNKKVNIKKLEEFGFEKKSELYKYSKEIMDGDFILNVEICDNNIQTNLIEKETQELYTLHLSDEEGTFIGQVRDQYNEVLKEISDKCFDNSVFKYEQTYKILDYIDKKYGDKPEYLWEKFPDNAIARRKDNQKWYLAILTVNKNKFGFETDEKVEVIDLRAEKELISELIQEKNIYPGYHMNKKSWISIILDNSMPIKNIYNFIDMSYNMAGKKK